MPVTCPICGGSHPKWECKRQDLIKVPLPELPVPGARPVNVFAPGEKPLPSLVDLVKVQEFAKLPTQPKKKRSTADSDLEITTTRTPEELAIALGLPPAETVARWKARMEKKTVYMKGYMKKYRARMKGK